ncbi:hypothetical protein EDB85DRAFT_1895022 [Lactarius pseudohatsudake]|nr:hypothetical protein EDB85DRAFT_1895022 [Lactarius pseudohatsudake]
MCAMLGASKGVAERDSRTGARGVRGSHSSVAPLPTFVTAAVVVVVARRVGGGATAGLVHVGGDGVGVAVAGPGSWRGGGLAVAVLRAVWDRKVRSGSGVALRLFVVAVGGAHVVVAIVGGLSGVHVVRAVAVAIIGGARWTGDARVVVNVVVVGAGCGTVVDGPVAEGELDRVCWQSQAGTAGGPSGLTSDYQADYMCSPKLFFLRDGYRGQRKTFLHAPRANNGKRLSLDSSEARPHPGDALRSPDIKAPLTMTWEIHAPAPPPHTLDNDNDDGFCHRDTLLSLPLPAPRTLDSDDGRDSDGSTHPHRHRRHLSRASPDCEVGHLATLNRACPDDEETTTRGTPHRSRPRAHPNDTGCNREDSAPAPLPVLVLASPTTAMATTQAATEGHPATCPSPAHARRPVTTSMGLPNPFALLAATTTRAAVEGTSHQFWLCVLTQSSPVRILYNDDDEGAGKDPAAGQPQPVAALNCAAQRRG